MSEEKGFPGYRIIESVDLASTEKAQCGNPCEHVYQTLRAQVCRCDVQLLNGRLLPLHLHYVFALQVYTNKLNQINIVDIFNSYIIIFYEYLKSFTEIVLHKSTTKQKREILEACIPRLTPVGFKLFCTCLDK